MAELTKSLETIKERDGIQLAISAGIGELLTRLVDESDREEAQIVFAATAGILQTPEGLNRMKLAVEESKG